MFRPRGVGVLGGIRGLGVCLLELDFPGPIAGGAVVLDHAQAQLAHNPTPLDRSTSMTISFHYNKLA